MPKITSDTTLVDALYAVTDENPGAESTVTSLRKSYSDSDFVNILAFLYEHGPRGELLWSHFKDDCGEDITVLGKYLKSRIEEFDEKAWEEIV